MGAFTLTNLILKLFIKKDNDCAHDFRTKCGTVGGAVGIAVNLLLALAKAVIGIIFCSIATVADAVNNLTDAASSVITLVGFKLAAKKPDEDHPYGHGRIEYISGLIMAFIVLMLGLILAKDSVLQIIKPKSVVFSWVGVSVLIIAILGKLWLSLFFKKLKDLTGSSAFAAASADSRNDVITTASVVVSLFVFKIFGVNIDGIAGALVSMFIIISGVGLIKETLDPLLGQPPEPEFVDTIYKKVMGYDGIIGIHDLVVHNYGPGRVFVSLHAEVDASSDILVSHDLIDNIERDFKCDLGIETVIHIDPVVTNDPYINELKTVAVATLLQIDSRLTLHDFRAVTGPTHTNIIFDVVLPNDMSANEIKSVFDKKIADTHPNVNSVITFDNSYI